MIGVDFFGILKLPKEFHLLYVTPKCVEVVDSDLSFPKPVSMIRVLERWGLWVLEVWMEMWQSEDVGLLRVFLFDFD